MSNLTGNYKISAGEVQGVDVAREQERRARLQLLDGIREPSPQPIFGEPVKVELEDETSRRIKNTLGDFTQVLVNDPKILLGISRSAPPTPAHGTSSSSRNQPVSKSGQRPVVPNGLYKQSPPAPPKVAPDKRYGYPRNKPLEAAVCLPTPTATLLSQDIRIKDPVAWDKEQRKTPGFPVVTNAQSLPTNCGSGVPNGNNSSIITSTPSATSSAASVPGGNKAFPFLGRNGMVSNTTVPPTPRFGEAKSSAPPPKRPILRPGILKLPERKPEKPAESPIELETILREMKQAVPPPLTAIQTPRTEESGFAFPAEPKEEVPFAKIEEKPKLHEPVPQPPEEPKSKDSSPHPAARSPYMSSSLQDDLEMSESDEENETVTEVQSTPAEYLKPPVNTAAVPLNNPPPTTEISNNMDAPPPVAANSSSSESGDSDSDDSSSESNDSDSSASSEASDADTPSKMWGLSNFFGDARRNNSPAFLPMDTSTNSSTAVKEEPMLVPTVVREQYCLVDEDSVNGILEYGGDLKVYLNSPITDPITDFLELDSSVNIKSEILSPIPSPLHSSAPPAPPVIRGPRTPPSPSYPVKEEVTEANGGDVPLVNTQTETVPSSEPSQTPSLSNKQSETVQNRNDPKDELGKVQNDKSRKLRLGKSKAETSSPKHEATPVTQTFEDGEPSASKGLPDSIVEKEKDDGTTSITTTSCSVPSESSESSHEIYPIKTRQKLSASSSIAKKNKSLSSENLSESGQKANNSSTKSATTPKFKHPTRACRISSEAKQNEKAAKNSNVTKSDQTEETKKRAKPEVNKEKVNVSNAEKHKEQVKVSNVKNAGKTSVKLKSKVPKAPPKQPEVKKPEVKRKKKKFSIKNFLQSPTFSQNESERLPRVSPVFSPSPERSPIPEYKRDSAEMVERTSVSPSRASQSPSRSSTKSEKVKNVEKLRRSARCSERASSIAQAESSTSNLPTSEVSRKSAKRIVKMRENVENLPIHMEGPPKLLSPIPRVSPVPDDSSDCAIPFKIMVSIPLDKLSRLPTVVQAQESENKQLSKSRTSLRSASEDAKPQKTDDLQREKATKPVNKRSQSKDFKDKPRTVAPLKSRNIKSAPVNKKEKNSKPPSEPLSNSKSKTASSVNNKSSIKVATDKPLCDDSENKIAKKRKSEEGDKQQVKKKPKVSAFTDRTLKENSATARNEATANQTDGVVKTKPLERCDSASSLSSLCSQQSQRSSKSTKEKLKDSSANLSEAKRLKASMSPLLSVKDIKVEKEEKPKVHIKKEPGIMTPDKNKVKSRDKLAPKDSDCLEKQQLWSEVNPSSQYCHWDDPCKDDPKGQLLSTQSLVDTLNRDTASDWDHFGPEMHKELKEPANLNKHNNQTPIMPMDYYLTEGKKQRQLAEKEKDPLHQALKYIEALVLFILTSQQREEYNKDPDSVYQFYYETLKFSATILQSVQKLQSCPGSTEFKLQILCLKCQSLLYVKLYNLKIKEIKEQLKGVSDFFRHQCPNALNSSCRNLSHPSPHQPRIASLASVPSPHSPTPSPASSVNSQTSGYSSSDVSGNHLRGNVQLIPQAVSVSQSILDVICRQHAHLINLHQGHDLWEQADMYMTRSNLREFFKEVADQSEPLTLHSSIKELVNYIQKGLSLVKKYPR